MVAKLVLAVAMVMDSTDVDIGDDEAGGLMINRWTHIRLTLAQEGIDGVACRVGHVGV